MTQTTWQIKLGWVLYTSLWLLLLANIVYDWLSYHWLSPLSVIFLIVLGLGTLLLYLGGKPIVSTEGMKERFLASLVFVLAIIAGVFGYIIFATLN